MKVTKPAINIQFPISRSILSGEKTVETRTYRIPEKYLGVDMYFVETPGIEGDFKARCVGIISFSECFAYRSKSEFYADVKRHLVDRMSPYRWAESQKWGWLIKKCQPFQAPVLIQDRRGIVFTKSLALNLSKPNIIAFDHMPGPLEL